jgi:sugar phosphate isomerase/epimerase
MAAMRTEAEATAKVGGPDVANPIARMQAFLARNAAGCTPSRKPDKAVAEKLLARTENLPLFAHSYPFIRNMDHGGFSPRHLAEFASSNDLAGICLHINDGGSTALSRMSRDRLDAYAGFLAGLGLKLHIEISSTASAEVDQAVALAKALGVANIRFYARHQGPLDRVIELVYADLCHAAEQANRYDLYFDYEQHEDLKAAEIAGLLQRVGDGRLNALFDYTNSWNAYEEPLQALPILAPWVRQVHIKGGRKTLEDGGWGQQGVAQGSAEDDLPSALLLYELLLLGEHQPQVICFALENEVGYYAPPFRRAGEGANPDIAYREPSETIVDTTQPLDRLLLDERRWAQQQVGVNRAIVAELRSLATAIVNAE